MLNNYKPFAEFSGLQHSISNKLNLPSQPDWKDVLRELSLIETGSIHRRFFVVVDIKEGQIVYSKGLRLLGYNNEENFSIFQFLNLVNEDYRTLTLNHQIALYKVLSNDKKIIKDRGISISTGRAIKDKKGDFWFTQQITYPLQMDNNGFVVRYLDVFTILDKYNGQALPTRVHVESSSQNNAEAITRIFEKVNGNMLKILGFTKTQRWVLQGISDFMYIGSSNINEKVAGNLETTVKTIYSHRNEINKKTKLFFRGMKFKTTEEIVSFFEKHLII